MTGANAPVNSSAWACLLAGSLLASAAAQQPPIPTVAPQPAAPPVASPAPQAAPAERSGLLVVGDPAPTIWIAKWLKGKTPTDPEPASAAENGEKPQVAAAPASVEWSPRGAVLVVEFWATWCGPCRRSMDGLTRLQAGAPSEKLRVVGVAGIDAHGETPERIEAFIKKHDARIGYTMILDDAARTREAWLGGARIMQIPAAFVVTPEGLIAWIGNPATSGGAMKRVVDELQAGTFDLGKAISRARTERERQAAALQQCVELQADLRRAMEEQDAARVADIIDVLIRLDAERYGRLGVTRFEALRTSRHEAAWDYARELVADRFRDDDVGLAALATAMTSGDEKHRDLDLALAAAQRACELTDHEDSRALEALARVRFTRGEPLEAVDAQQKAVAAAITEGTRQRLVKTLAEYRKAVKPARK